MTTILNPDNLCSPSPYLIIVICSSIPNKTARRAIRNTWASNKNLENVYNSTVKIVFLLGQSENDTLNVSNVTILFSNVLILFFYST